MDTHAVATVITAPSGLSFSPAANSFSVWSKLKRMRSTMCCPMLSMKTVLQGEEIYHFSDRTVRLRPGEFMLVPERAEYGVQVETRFDTHGRCYYFSDHDVRGLNRLVDVLGSRLHQAKFEWPELFRDQLPDWHEQGTHEVADALNRWAVSRLNQLARVDRVDPLTKTRVLSGLERAYRAIHEHYDQAWTVTELAEAAHLSRASFTRSFTRLYGISPKRLLEKVRLQAAAEQIAERADSITTISLNCGYADLPTFSRAFRRHYGISPSGWAKQQASAV